MSNAYCTISIYLIVNKKFILPTFFMVASFFFSNLCKTCTRKEWFQQSLDLDCLDFQELLYFLFWGDIFLSFRDIKLYSTLVQGFTTPLRIPLLSVEDSFPDNCSSNSILRGTRFVVLPCKKNVSGNTIKESTYFHNDW